MRTLADEMKKGSLKAKGLKEQIGKSKGLADLKRGKKTGTMSNIDKNTNNWFK